MSDVVAVGQDGSFKAPESVVETFLGAGGPVQPSKINNSDLMHPADPPAETLAWRLDDPPAFLTGDEVEGVDFTDRWRPVDTVAPEGGVL